MNCTTLNFHYDFLTSLVLNDPEFFTKKVPFMKAVGVRTVWLDNYIYGEWQNTPEEAARAKAMLEAEGFEVQAICVPLGHGGNALMGGDEDDPSLPPEFRNRIDVYNKILSRRVVELLSGVVAFFAQPRQVLKRDFDSFGHFSLSTNLRSNLL